MSSNFKSLRLLLIGYTKAEKEILMTQSKKKLFSTLAQDLKNIRKRPLSDEQIEKANKVLDKQREDLRKDDLPKRKIARRPEADA